MSFVRYSSESAIDHSKISLIYERLYEWLSKVLNQSALNGVSQKNTVLKFKIYYYGFIPLSTLILRVGTGDFIVLSHQPSSCFKTRLKHTKRYKMSDFKDFKVADFNLWEWGRKEILIGKQLLNLN